MANLPDLSRLKVTLLKSGLQQKDQPLYQVIDTLIDFLRKSFDTLEGQIASGSSGSGGGNSGTTIIQQIMLGDGDGNNSGDIGPPGINGTVGTTGAAGPTGLTGLRGSPGNDGNDGIDGMPGPAGRNAGDLNYIWVPLTDGDIIEPSLIFDSLGNCVMAQEFY